MKAKCQPVDVVFFLFDSLSRQLDFATFGYLGARQWGELGWWIP